MAKTKGPGLSLHAAGSIGNAFTFSNWRGRSYAKKKSHPKNPRSGLQVGSRAMIRFLSKQWTNLTPTMKETYADLALQWETSNYHAYLKANQHRWTTGLFPSMEWPPALSVDAGLMAFATSQVNGFTVTFTLIPQTPNYNWGAIAYVYPTQPYTPAIANAYSIDPWDVIDPLTITYGPFAAGTYKFRFGTFSYEGKPQPPHSSYFSVTITG